MLKYFKNNTEKCILLLIILLGAVLRVYNFWDLSLSNDEFSAIARAQPNSFSEFISKGICADIHPAGVEFFLFLWIKVFGTSVFMVRLPFVVSGILSIYIAYRIAKRWFNEHTALFVALAFSVLEFPLMYSQLARPFAPALLFSLLTVFFWTKLLFDNETGKKNIIYLALSICMAAYCHYFAAVFVMMVAVSGAFFLKKENLKSYLMAIIIAVILYIPNIFVIIQQVGNPAGITWLVEPDSNWFFKHIYFLLNGSKLLLYFVIAFFVTTHILSFTEVKFSKFHVLSITWFVFPFLTAFCYSIFIKPILEDSILLFSFPFFIIFMFSFLQKERKMINYPALILFAGLGIYNLFAETEYYTTYHFGEFKDLAAKTIEWNDEVGNANVTRAINVNDPYYINYYLDKAGKPLSFAMYRNQGKTDLHTLNKLVQGSKTPYFLYAWSGVVDPNETRQIILAKYPYIVKQVNYNDLAEVTLYSMNDSKHAMPQPKPVYYLFNGFENKETWDKDTSILSRENVWQGKYAAKLDAADEYGPAFAKRISLMTDSSFRRVQVSLWAYATGIYKDAQIVATINFKDDENQQYENYFWLSSKFEYFIDPNKWGQVFFSFNLPELRSRNDELKLYVWNPDKKALYIDNFEVKLFRK